MNRKHTAALNVLGLSVAAAVVTAAAGCSDQPKQAAYGSNTVQPSSSMSSDSSMTMPPSNEIPAGAQRLSQGTYNQILFTIPSNNGAGSLFLYDMDTRKVVGMTNSVEANAGKSMTMADLKNTAQGLNMTDQYQVYFAPTHVTTQPIGSPGGM